MFTSIFEGLRRIAPACEDPDRVVEVHVEDFVLGEVLCREDCLVIYRRPEGAKQRLDIVMQLDLNHSYSKAFSIHRSGDESSCRRLFELFRARVPLLVECVPEIGVSKFVLQNVLQLIREKPSWSAAHVAAHFGYTACFKHPVIQSQINMRCEESLVTPLHVAVRSQQVASVVALTELDARMDAVDATGDTVFHYAATTTRDIIQVLSRHPSASGVLNALNGKGCTPFQLACMADRVDCVMEFLKAGVDVNLGCAPAPEEEAPSRCMKDVLDTYSSRFCNMDIKYGGTPLHWSKTPELTEVLIEHGCRVNARNFEGDTALHVMVRRNRLSCALALLSHRADPDARNAHGDAPVHLAVRTGDVSMVQTFIAFGADLEVLNNRGESPRHCAAAEGRSQGDMLYALHAVGASRCAPALSCNDGCSPGGQFNGIPPENCSFSRKYETVFEEILQLSGGALPGGGGASATEGAACRCRASGGGVAGGRCRVLSLDGGGIRGLVLIQMLDELERIVGRPLHTCFDFVAGTSTGGILALVLAIGRSMKDARCLYFRLKDKVFVGSRPYDADLLETFLKNELGESTLMGDIRHPNLGDRKPADLHMFRNYESPLEVLKHVETDPLSDDPLPNPRDQLIWKAGRATGAAPTYFRASGPYIDGGLVSNNPTLDALTEIHQRNQALRATGQEAEVVDVSVVVSMGTGRPPLVPVNTIDVFRPDTMWGACKMALGITSLGQLLVDQATQTDGRVTSRALAVCGMLGVPYFRLNPQLTEGVALDETNPRVLVRMLWETTAYMRSIRQDLDHIRTLLLVDTP
ncbi:85/88 kDa calcium-independent phospholipase A2-like [Uloborus diversus]|uniref:85/88 kDa calcium-independent phospholipase A2-like n=1 Tax=Uloborus diversus TaxID=327109 RepID=UPI002409EE99|nr:85/88 kDa calcium-independent phospholipase A2-like [Uloborus diversus]